ncbi:MAG: hypothetical protein ACRDKG_05445 [Actinomycetota bacterium]
MAKRAAAPRRSARAFLQQVADELPNHLPPRLRDFSSEQWGRYYKVWFGADKKVHFEVQFIAGGRLEIGLHLESDPATNERIGSTLELKRAAIRRALGEEAAFGSHGNGWRSLAERWSGGDLRAEETATEAAARLAEYVEVVAPLLSGRPRG